ncbi:NUDIX domain-containing protein [Streptomyces sp. 8N114]|uniref:NUDIX domain-containing protein n=1 Tax=Streptomyces sp. 8N114 TaxID=3457419 RepID=UPI003FD50DE8
MGYVTSQEWDRHYADGRGFRPLGDAERALLTEHLAAPGDGTALDVGCGTGELAHFLAGLGYRVDAVDQADSALTRARAEHAAGDKVRWLRLDVEHDDFAELRECGYHLITLRLAYPFLRDRARVLRGLGERLRPGGALVVITPLAERVSPERRDIALDEEEIGLLAEGWGHVERFDAGGLAMLVLRGAPHSFVAVEKGRPVPRAVAGACGVVTDGSGRVLLGRSVDGMWELPGGRTESGESFEATAVRELAEETGLRAGVEDAQLRTILLDDNDGVPRVSAVVCVNAWSGTLMSPCPEPDRFRRWEWHDPGALGTLGPVFAPSAQALEAVWPGALPGLPPLRTYSPASDDTAGLSAAPAVGESGDGSASPSAGRDSRAARGVWPTIEGLARTFDAHSDARGLDREQQWTLQVLKLSEETGEAAQAVIGVQGTNPRKGYSHSWEDVHAEVADVVITGLVALARMRPADAADYLDRQLTAKAARFR